MNVMKKIPKNPPKKLNHVKHESARCKCQKEDYRLVACWMQIGVILVLDLPP